MYSHEVERRKEAIELILAGRSFKNGLDLAVQPRKKKDESNFNFEAQTWYDLVVIDVKGKSLSL